MERRKVKNGEKAFRLSLAPFICPWVSEDGLCQDSYRDFGHCAIKQLLVKHFYIRDGRDGRETMGVFKNFSTALTHQYPSQKVTSSDLMSNKEDSSKPSRSCVQ